jgi:threonine/homoserine efflux transporter RhtA
MEWLTVFVVGSIVCLALVRFDVLTQFVCLFCSYLTIETSACWNLFRDVGNFQYTAVFVCCGALILLSAFLAFRRSFVAAKARLAKIYE